MKKKSKAAKVTKSKVDNLVGSPVTYIPSENDFAARPKGTPMPAIVTGVSEKQIKDVTITVYSLSVFQDTPRGIERRLKVKHEKDAVEGDSYFTTKA